MYTTSTDRLTHGIKAATDIEDFLSRHDGDMLKLSGNRELYPRDKRDALIMFTLQRQGKIFMANDLLDNHALETLGIVRKER